MKGDDQITVRQALYYEIRGSWWGRFIGWNWLQSLSAAYFAWKVRRKYGRYLCSLKESRRVSDHVEI